MWQLLVWSKVIARVMPGESPFFIWREPLQNTDFRAGAETTTLSYRLATISQVRDVMALQWLEKHQEIPRNCANAHEPGGNWRVSTTGKR